jgi:hypothetical protein
MYSFSFSLQLIVCKHKNTTGTLPLFLPEGENFMLCFYCIALFHWITVQENSRPRARLFHSRRIVLRWSLIPLKQDLRSRLKCLWDFCAQWVPRSDRWALSRKAL